MNSLAAHVNLPAPAIGGQHVTYLVKQLKAFCSVERSNDVGEVMRNIVAKLRDEQIEAVSKYIATLGG